MFKFKCVKDAGNFKNRCMSYLLLKTGASDTSVPGDTICCFGYF